LPPCNQENTMSIKFTLPAAKPRNPLAAAARSRRAGSHRHSGGALRQQAQHALRRDLHRHQDSP
jgi:hypothetical protein